MTIDDCLRSKHESLGNLFSDTWIESALSGKARR